MRHPVLLALVLSCTFAFALPDAVVAQSDAEIAMKGAREAFAADEFEKAVKLAETAAQTDGENPDIHLLLAKSRLQLGDLDESLASFRRVIEIAPKHSYAAQMVKALEGRSDNVALRLKLAADLLSDGMPGPASQELSAVKKSASLTDRQRLDVLRMTAEVDVQFGHGEDGLTRLRELILLDPGAEQSTAIRLLTARAQVASGSDLAAIGLASLKEIAAADPESDAGKIAAYELIAYRLSRGEQVVEELEKWLADNAKSVAARRARGQLRVALNQAIQSASQLPKPKADARLDDLDRAALNAASLALNAYADPQEQLDIVTIIRSHFDNRYAVNLAFGAAREGLQLVAQMEVPSSARRTVEKSLAEVANREASQEYSALTRKILEGNEHPDALAQWIQKHPDHSYIKEANVLLIRTLLTNTRKQAKPKAGSKLAANDTQAIEVAGALFAADEDAKTRTIVVDLLQTHLLSHYQAVGAFDASIAGLEALSQLELDLVNRTKIEKAVLDAQKNAALAELKSLKERGLLKKGPLPERLSNVIKTIASMNAKYPSAPVWKTQADLAKAVYDHGAGTPWPTRIAEPKPAFQWAVTLAIPVVGGSSDPATIAAARGTIDAIVNDCLKATPGSVDGMATAIHSQMLAVVDPDSVIRSSVVLRHVDLLSTDAANQFAANVRSGERQKNEQTTEIQKQIVELLGELVSDRPALATAALQKLEAHLNLWAQNSIDAVIEDVYGQFADRLPPAQKTQVQLSVARLWFSQVVRNDEQVLASGFEVERKLNPAAERTLKQCYELASQLGKSDPLRVQVLQLRQQVIDHYVRLEFKDVVETAIRVRGEQPDEDLEEAAQLQLAQLKKRVAEHQLQRQLKLLDGQKQLTLTPEFNEAIAALKKFISDHPTSERVQSAASSLIAIGKTFEQNKAWDAAATVYADVEQFADGLGVLSQDLPGHNVAEQAALARASALQTRAARSLEEAHSRRKEEDPVPVAISDQYQASMNAWKEIVKKYEGRPIVRTAIVKITDVARDYARIGSWDVADAVYGELLTMELPLRAPERLEFARSICQLGKVMPDHSRSVLAALVIAGPPARRVYGPGGAPDPSTVAQIQNGAAAEAADGDDAAEKSLAEGGAVAGMGLSLNGQARGGDISGFKSDAMTSEFGDAPAGFGGGGFGGAAGMAGPGSLNEGIADFRSRSDAQLLIAVQNQLSQQSREVAMLRDSTLQRRAPAQQQAEAQNSSQPQVPSVAVLSDAELKRQSDVLDNVYASLQKIRKEHPDSVSASQSRDEIFILINHWRRLTKWSRAAELARRFLKDNPRDIALPQVRQEVARDLLAFASQGVTTGGLTNQEMLDEIGIRFDKAREELAGIVAAFPEATAVRQQAQWDIANSFLTQARVVAGSSPTLARGQFVRAANELLKVADLYHDHPKISTVPDMLWSIADELARRTYNDEAIEVWNELTLNFPTHGYAGQAAMRTAQTWAQIGQPLRAAEAYLELNFARGGNDTALQNTVLQIAVNLKTEKRWIESLHVLQTFVDSFPAHPSAGQALTMIGQIHQENEVWEDAIAAFSRVIDEFDSGDWATESRWAIAECTINLSRWPEAMGAYAEFQKMYPKDARLAEATRRIEILKTLDRYQNIIDEEGQRKAFDAQFQIASIMRTQLANPVKAIIEYRKVTANWPNSHLADDALFEVGQIYLEKGETEAAREALLEAASSYPTSPLADDALFLVGTSFVSEADGLSAVDRSKSQAIAKDIAQREAYQVAQDNRRRQVSRNLDQIQELKKQGKRAEAANKEAHFASQALQFDSINTSVISNWAAQKEEMLSAEQLADRQDKINAALRKAVQSFRQAAKVTAANRADDALLQMAQIYDERLKDSEAAMATWEEIVKQYSGTAVAEDASWKIAEYYEQHQEHKKAIDAYQSFLRNYRRSPRAGQAQASIAENHENLGEWVQAMDAYTNYLNNFPDGPQATRAREQISWIKTYRL